MPSLPLDDTRWSTLWTRYGSATDVPKQIADVLSHPEDTEQFDKLTDVLYSDGTTWSSGFAAVPYIIEIARRLPPAQRLRQLTAMGFIVADACLDSKNEHYILQPYLADSYYQAIHDCLPLLAETLLCELKPGEIFCLLFSAAALKGHARLAAVLENLDCCPNCSEIMGWP